MFFFDFHNRKICSEFELSALRFFEFLSSTVDNMSQSKVAGVIKHILKKVKAQSMNMFMVHSAYWFTRRL